MSTKKVKAILTNRAMHARGNATAAMAAASKETNPEKASYNRGKAETHASHAAELKSLIDAISDMEQGNNGGFDNDGNELPAAASAANGATDGEPSYIR